MKNDSYLIYASLLSMLCADIAMAQLELEETVVTARKREESLQDTPVSVTAFSNVNLEERSISNIRDINAFTPNLEINSGRPDGGASAAQIYIRGVGQSDFLFPNDPGVGMYVDGIYLARSIGGMMSLVDIERIEVLRGPQGTLYGKNTIGGAINIVTTKPAEEFGGSAELTVGRFDRTDGKVSVDVPLVDGVLYSKFAVGSLDRDGYGEQILTGRELGDEEKLVGRGQLLWIASDTAEVNFSIDATRVRENNQVGTLLDVRPDAPALGGLFNGLVIPTVHNPALGLPADSILDERWLTGDEFESNGTFPAINEVDVWGASVTVDLAINDNLDFKSITAYRELEAHFSRDSDHTPYPALSTDNFGEQEQLSQELQLSGLAFDGRLNWLAGIFYFDEHAVDDNDVKILSGSCEATGGVPNCDVEIDLLPFNEIDIESWAGFTHASYDFTDKLSMSLGARYTWEEKEYFQFHRRTQTARVIVGPRKLKENWTAFSPKIGLDYQINDDVMAYGLVSRGFKSGGWTPRPLSGNVGENPFDPEFLTSFEMGFKSKWADNRLILNAAVFYNTYEDIQITTVESNPTDGLLLDTQNAAESTLTGFELELFALPVQGLDIQLGLGYLDNEYDKLDPDVTIPKDAVLQDAPEWSFNGGVQYAFNLADMGKLTLRGDAAYKSKIYKDAFNLETLAQDAYWIFNARLAFEPESGKWQVALFGTNLGDETYITNAIDAGADLGFAEAYYGRPREWGLSAKLNF